jgi:hypothetical protein
MSIWRLELKSLEYPRKPDATQQNKQTAGPVPDPEQKAQESKGRQVLQIVGHSGFKAKVRRADGQKNQRRGVEPRHRAGQTSGRPIPFSRFVRLVNPP